MKRMKKLVSMGIIIAMLGTMTACGSSSKTTSDASSADSTAKTEAVATESAAAGTEIDTSNMGPTLQKVYDKGVLTVGIDSGYPPFSFTDPSTGESYGIAVDIAQGVADKLGVELKVVPESFGTLLSDLQTDKLDMVCACVTVTDERKEVMAFSKPYIQTGDCMVVRTADADQYSDLASFAGKTISANNGTSQQTNAESIENATVVACESTSDAVLQVTSGTVDACVVDNVNGKQYIAASEGALTMIETASFSYADKAIGIQLGNDDLVEIVNSVIDEINPNMDNLIDKYIDLSIDVLGVQ